MAVKIKLARLGKIREPFYRVVIADSRTRRGGRAIELVGKYQPKAEPSVIEINSDRVQYWLGVGAQPTESVLGLLKVTGDWQKFKGLPGAEGTLKPQPAKVDKRARYEAALAAIGGSDAADATTPRRKSAKKDEPTQAAPAAESAPQPKAGKAGARAAAEATTDAQPASKEPATEPPGAPETAAAPDPAKADDAKADDAKADAAAKADDTAAKSDAAASADVEAAKADDTAAKADAAAPADEA